MALTSLTSLVSENSTAPERIIWSQVDLVIDLSSLNFNWVSQDKVKEVINKRAEEQVDADDEIKAIKDFIKSGKATFDSIMDASLISAEKRLRDILVEAGVEAVNIKVALTELASSIDFKLTDIGKERFNSVMDAKQVQSYYGASWVDVADCTLLTNTTTPSIIPPTPKPNIINNPYSWAWAEASNPTAVENKDSVTNNVNNLPVNYVQYNIRRSADADLEGDDWVQERDQIKDTKFQAKRILKKIKNGTDEDLAIVAENDQIGDRKVNLATKEDKTYLKEYFMKPLKILCLRNAVAGRDIDPEIFWSILMSAHGKDGAKIADDKYRESNTSGLDIHNVKKFANQMSKLWKMYVQYNTQTDTQKSFNNGYIQQVVGMMDNYVRSAVDIADFNSWKTGVRDLYTKFNNASKNLSWVDILDGKKDEEKAKSLLDDTVWKESQSLTSAYRQSAVETYNIKQLVDNGSLFGKYKSTNEEWFANFLGDTSFSGGLDNSDMWMRGWQQILAQFRIAVEQYAYKEKLNIQDPNQLKKAQTGILKHISKRW